MSHLSRTHQNMLPVGAFPYFPDNYYNNIIDVLNDHQLHQFSVRLQ